MGEVLKELEKEADIKLSKNPNDLGANRVKARACFARREMSRALRYAKRGIPVGDNGEIEVVRTRNGKVDVQFAKLVSDLYIDEGKWDEAIQWRESYAEHFPPTKTAIHGTFLKDLEELKAKKKIGEELLKDEQNLKDEPEKQKKKKGKTKPKPKISSSEVKEEKESDLYIDESKRDEAIQFTVYAQHSPSMKVAMYQTLLEGLEELKAKKKIAGELKDEQNLKAEPKKKKKKKKGKTGKTKAEISSGEVEEEKESIKSKEKNEDACTIVECETKNDETDIVQSAAKNQDWTTTVTYHVFMKRNHGVFVGTMGSGNFDMEDQSFIEASDLQLFHYNQLKVLGSSCAGILYVERRFRGPQQKTYFVVERVKSIDLYFQELLDIIVLQDFQKLGDFLEIDLDDVKRWTFNKLIDFMGFELDKAKWWILISKLFTLIFRDVMEILQFLYSKEITCGNLLSGLYVTPDGRAKILPSMDCKQTATDDLKQLIEKMKSVIGMPFGTIDVVEDPEFDLPLSLKHFLASYNRTSSKLVPWVLKAPFFWTTDEEFKFLDGVTQLVGSNCFVRNDLEHYLYKYPVYSKGNWFHVLDGPYKAVWKNGDPEIKRVIPLPDGCFEINPYLSSCDLYSYLCAAKDHIKMKEYKTLRTAKAKYASDIKGYYQTIYTDSHEIIHAILSKSPELIDCFMSIVSTRKTSI